MGGDRDVGMRFGDMPRGVFSATALDKIHDRRTLDG